MLYRLPAEFYSYMAAFDAPGGRGTEQSAVRAQNIWDHHGFRAILGIIGATGDACVVHFSRDQISAYRCCLIRCFQGNLSAYSAYSRRSRALFHHRLQSTEVGSRPCGNIADRENIEWVDRKS